MRISIALTALVLAGSLSAQDVLYYKFEAGYGNKVINYASGTAAGPAEGTLAGSATATQQWTAGKFGGGLMGGDVVSPYRQNYVDSGWNGAFSGSFSVAWFMKLRGTQGTGLSYVFSGIGSFRCFTNGVAGKGLWLRNWYTTGSSEDIKLSTDIQALAAKGWVHVAIVVDATKKTATWYLDGVAQTPQNLTNSPAVAATTTNFRVGMHTSTSSAWQYDTDEFRFMLGAASAGQVLAWSKAADAADQIYGKGCGGRLFSMFPGTPPTLGTAKYGVTAAFSAGGPAILSIGGSRTHLLGVPVFPFDLGNIFPNLKGCNWESSMDLIFGLAVPTSGSINVPLPIPQDTSLKGATLYLQSLLLNKGKEETTNGFAISIE